ncbi:MAG: caspase family protein, partial [Bacteroidia bacterium]|nr:caspase family protein [Bacteroidia bacterium]
GKVFAENLQAALFESDVEIAANSERNRVILTTVDIGYDSSKCDKSHAPLTKYILDSGNMLDVFENYYDYEYRLNKQEVKCSIRDTRYYFISREVDYKKILARHLSNSSGTRGSQSRKVKPKEKEKGQSKTYALIIATNVYNDDQTSWNDLKNPLNDANSIATILEQKYNAKIHKIYNEPKREIISGILKLKRQMDDNDKLLLFIAGHGHFSEDYSQGFLVSTDSQTLEDDPTLESYFSMAKLNSILDGFPSKQVFTVLDVCYGASFELNNADLPIENYSNTEIDNNLDDFISDVDKSYARIMLASGQYEVFDYWKDSQKHSPFASKLIKAFNNEKEFISPGKIFSYVRGNTTTPILKKFGKHEVTGDFLLKVY